MAFRRSGVRTPSAPPVPTSPFGKLLRLIRLAMRPTIRSCLAKGSLFIMAYYIPIIAGSTRRERQSIKVARFVLARLKQRPGVETELLDLLEFNFPIMEERLHRRDDPPPRLQEYADKIGRADAFIIVTPEYNNGYPGVLKNALDYLLPEYERKPIGIATVSAGGHGGITCLAQLGLVTLGMGAFPIPENLAISRVRDSFKDDGTPNDPAYEKRATAFLDEVL